jgi:hypothetical protein
MGIVDGVSNIKRKKIVAHTSENEHQSAHNTEEGVKN